MRARATGRSVVGIVLVCGLIAAARPVHAAHPHHVLKPLLVRTAARGGCCDLHTAAFSPDTVSVVDASTGFSATVEHLSMSWGHIHGSVTLWLYVLERNESSVVQGLTSGPGNWLLFNRDDWDSTYSAFGSVPPRHGGVALAHVDSLLADTNPANEGWIGFHIPSATQHYTLAWSDCMPRCSSLPVTQAYGPIADVSFVRSTRPINP